MLKLRKIMFKDITSKLDDFEKWQRIAALTVFAVHKPRIFEQGKAADGTSIGKYSPGYKAKRKSLGKETAFVNLEFYGSMKKDYQVTKSGIVGFGFSNQVEAEKADKNENHFKKVIFDLTNAEAELYTKTLDELIFGKK